MRIELVAGAAEHGARLDVALGGRPEVGSRAAAQRLIDAGAVTVDGRARPKRHLLSEGERVVAIVERSETTLPADTAAPHSARAGSHLRAPVASGMGQSGR